MVTLTINGEQHELDVPDEMPLLWVIRDVVGLTGTKFGCGMALCGCCTMHIDGQAMRTCVLPASYGSGKKITTIEGLSPGSSSALQKAWIAEQVPQCGYCQSGQLMAASSLLAKNLNPTDAEIDATMTNICRCGTYEAIRAAIHRAAGQSGESQT
jgi:isoquinoline 1-oxidoreductase subunit alpha